MSARAFFWFAVLCVVAAFVAVNALSSVLLRGSRLDLTENQLYTLSDGTRATLASFDEPVDVTFFYSRSLAQSYPAIRAYGARVREMLEAYSDISGGALRLEIVDPEPFSEEEDRAIASALEGVPTGDGEQLYMGLTARNSVDEQITIPLFSPEREPFLEYELTRALSDLDAPARPRVGLLAGLPLSGGASPFGGGGRPPLYVYRQIESAFDLVDIDEEFEELPEALDILLIVHPPPLSDDQLFLIDQWILANGRALILVDPLSRLAMEAGPLGLAAPNSRSSSDLGPLLEAWGVDYAPNDVVLDFQQALRASLLEDGRRVQRAYPAWIGVTPSRLNQDDLSTAPLDRGINFATAGSFSPRSQARATFTPLARSSEETGFVDAAFAEGDPSPRALMEAMRVASGGRVLAASISGEIDSAFTDGRPSQTADEAGEDANVEEEAAAAPDAAESAAPDEAASETDADAASEPAPAAPTRPPSLTSGRAEIVLVADTDLLDDMFYVQDDPVFGPTSIADNAAFIANVLDRLAGSDALISLRSRAPSARPMTLIDEMRADAEELLAERQAQLQAELEDAQANLVRLESQSRAEGFLPGDPQIADEALAELDRARESFAAARSRLREVQRNFRVGIDNLEGWLIFLNAWLAPILIALAGLWVSVARRRAQGLGRSE